MKDYLGSVRAVDPQRAVEDKNSHEVDKQKGNECNQDGAHSQFGLQLHEMEADVQKEMEEIVSQADELRVELSELIQKDAEAFDGVMRAYRLPKETEEQKRERESSIQAATLEAAQVPLKTCQEALKVLRLAVVAAEKGNKNAITDAGTASALAVAAIASAGVNVRINLQSLTENSIREKLSIQLNGIESETCELDKQVRKYLKARAQISLL